MNSNNRFFDGFLLGVIIGSLAVYLFGTKSGKKLVKVLSEQGLEGISDLMENQELENMEEEFEDESPEVIEEIKNKARAEKVNLGNEPHIAEKAPKKRFFKRLGSLN